MELRLAYPVMLFTTLGAAVVVFEQHLELWLAQVGLEEEAMVVEGQLLVKMEQLIAVVVVVVVALQQLRVVVVLAATAAPASSSSVIE